MVGFGTFFYPIPLTIGKLSRDSVPSEHSRVIKTMAILNEKSNVKVAISDDGFLCVFGLEKSKALELINTIFALVMLRLKIICYAAKEYDLCECFYQSKIFYITGITGDNLRNYLQFRRSPMEGSEEWKIYPRKTVTVSTIENVIQSANDFYKNVDIHRDLLLLSDGFTLYYQNELNASYLYAWMMIETFLSKIWEQHVRGLHRTNDEKHNLLRHDKWTAYHLVEMFGALKMIKEDTMNFFHSLRKRRNDIIHNRKDVTSTETLKCLTTAWKILKNREDTPTKPFKGL